MKRFRAPRRPSLCVAAAAFVHLAGCAAAPPKIAPSAAPAAVTQAPAVVTMAPIPNPQEPAPKERRVPSHPRPTSAGATGGSKSNRSKAAASEAPAPAQAAPAASAVDPARAAKLRARGLEELDRGSVARAVALLGQANRLDPSSVVIRHDLERAQRIARAVHGGQ